MKMNIRRSKLFAESWNVAIRRKKQGDILMDLETPFKILKNNFSSWCADPFIFEYKQKTYIFAEIYDYRLHRGTIGYTILNEGKIGKWKQVIVEEYHLSYPFIFQQNEEVYIIPESSQNNSLYIYKAVDFPNKWKKEAVLADDRKFVDTTLFQMENQVYAFTTDVSSYENQKEYILKFNNKGIEDINEIPVNNFKTSRMGGKVFQRENKIIKVCQDCRKTYGGGLMFKEFRKDKVDGNTIQHILPESLIFDKKILIDGIHTYNANSEYEIIDIKTRRFNLLNLLCRFINKAR